MTAKLPIRYVARATIQFTTPFAVRSGRDDLFSDSVFVEDANGLPAIPGSSIAGVLRHAFRRLHPESDEDIFGAMVVKGEDRGKGSRLIVSWAAIHDGHDRPVEGLRDPGLDDPVIENALLGVIRDHVRLNARGTADARGKYEETLVARGHRFTFELALSGTDNDMPVWRSLLGVLRWPGLRLGGGTRRGYGAFELVRVSARRFDLRDPEDFASFAALPVVLGEAGLLDPVPVETIVMVAPASAVELTLEGFGPREPWLIGGGTAETGEDFAPVMEPVIDWTDSKGRVSPHPVLVVPASGVKGALAHRLAWHFNLLQARRSGTGRWADDAPTVGTGAENPAVRAAFGDIKSENEGRVGRVILDDLYIETPQTSRSVWHVGIDAFTGGARRGRLFSERVVDAGYREPEYRLTLIDPDAVFDEPLVVEALAATLDDVRRGRLFLGAGAGRGNGRFGCDAIRVRGEGMLADKLNALIGSE